MPAARLSDTLVVLHQGHDAPCVLPDGDPDFDGVADWLNQLGCSFLFIITPAPTTARSY